MIVKRLACHAGFDHAVEILSVHGEDAVHVREIERHAAEGRVDLAFERGAGAERNDRHARLGAKPRPISTTSCVVSAKTTASGGWQAIQVSVLACCSRSAVPVEKRLPKRDESRASRARLASVKGRSGVSAATMLMAAVYHRLKSPKARP